MAECLEWFLADFPPNLHPWYVRQICGGSKAHNPNLGRHDANWTKVLINRSVVFDRQALSEVPYPQKKTKCISTMYLPQEKDQASVDVLLDILSVETLILGYKNDFGQEIIRRSIQEKYCFLLIWKTSMGSHVSPGWWPSLERLLAPCKKEWSKTWTNS